MSITCSSFFRFFSVPVFRDVIIIIIIIFAIIIIIIIIIIYRRVLSTFSSWETMASRCLLKGIGPSQLSPPERIYWIFYFFFWKPNYMSSIVCKGTFYTLCGILWLIMNESSTYMYGTYGWNSPFLFGLNPCTNTIENFWFEKNECSLMIWLWSDKN